MPPSRLMQYPQVADNGGFQITERGTEQEQNRNRAQTSESIGGIRFSQRLIRNHRQGCYSLFQGTPVPA